MSICLKQNYDKNKHSSSISLQKIRIGTIEEAIDDIYSVLKESPFSTDIESSDNRDAYIDSIQGIVDNVREKIKDLFSKEDVEQIIEGVKSKLTPPPLTKVEQRISAVIEGTDLIRQKEIDKMNYRKMLKFVYGTNNLSIDSTRVSQFENSLQNILLFNQESNTLIDSDYDLNKNIINYQNQQYKIIRDFLIKYYFSDYSKLFPLTYYSNRTRIPNVKSTLEAMFNIINHLKDKMEFSIDMENGQNDTLLGQTSPNSDLYNAVSAYINLVYFDANLRNSVSDFININRNLHTPIYTETTDYGKEINLFKYTIKTGNSNAIKSWGNDNPDSVKLISNFTKFIINRIPVYSYLDDSNQHVQLTAKDFIGTIVKLKDIGHRVTINTNFKEACSDLANGIKNLQTIFEILFVNKDKDVIKALKDLQFDDNNLNILYSIYRTVFNTENKTSWINLENNYLKKYKGFRSRYNLVNALYGIMCSNSALNYLQTVYNPDTEQYETSVKEKFSITNSKFDIKNFINRFNQSRTDLETILDLYKIEKLSDNKSYSIQIGDTTYEIKVGKYNILAKKRGKGYIVKQLDKFKNIDISNYSQRQEVINAKAGTLEWEFKELLSFIDSMLDTNFSVSDEELKELYLSSVGYNSFLKDIFITATRALVVSDLNHKFNTAKDKPSNIKDFLESLGGWENVYDANDLSEFFDKTKTGLKLNVAYVNEPWITKLAKVRAILSGDTVTSVISDLAGNKNPNSSPVFLGSTGEIRHQMQLSNIKAKATSHLLFSKIPSALIRTTINTDVKTSSYVTKSIKDMTKSELMYDAIINKFLISYDQTGHIFTQSTTQSDKTKFVSSEVNLLDLGLTLKTPESIILDKWRDTIGEAYKETYKKVINDYTKVFGLTSIQDINNALKGTLETSRGFINSEKLLINAVNEYNEQNPNDQIVFYKDLHYRELKNCLAFNELLYEFSQNLYNKDTKKFEKRIKLEKNRFLNELTDNLVRIEYTPQLKAIISKHISNFEDSFWVKKVGNKEYLILAKSSDKDILFGKVDEKAKVILNPVLDKFFLIDGLIGNNLRHSTTGSEINHKIKALKSLNLKNEVVKKIADNEILLSEFNGLTSNLENLTFYDLHNLKATSSKLKKILDDVYNEQVYLIENLGQNAQFKRNVIISATMTKFIPSLEGIGKTMNIACIKDLSANVCNYSGKYGKIDAHDGSALVSPLWSILENKSLGPNEVGDIKKPIHHAFNDDYMTATLLKYATDTITNNWMRESINNSNGINLHNLFMKMHNQRWNETIDLINGCGFKINHRINFSRDILEQDNNPNNYLYYNKGGHHYRISDFGKDINGYYTEEQQFDISPENPTGKLVKVYHYFNDAGEHFTEAGKGRHTIDSLYELHTALGGIWTERWDGNSFVYSEGSNLAVVNFINNVANKVGDNDDLTIENYEQPLKQMMVHMIANESAVKNGIGNINPSSSWSDNTKLSYITLSTNNYGIQQDSDHTADEAKMTEFSQVISSLDAGGYLHDYVAQIYELLGKTALDLAEVELEAVKAFRESGNKSKLYDVVGRTIIANLKNGSDTQNLTDAIVTSIKNQFDRNTDHNLDKLLLPFSDPNIYSQLISSFVSVLNKKSIKRQYPGLGTVMAPSYNMRMIYDISDGKGGYEQLQLTDLLKLAQQSGITSNYIDVTKYNQDIINQYLQKQQDAEPNKEPIAFYPTDNVLAKITYTDLDGVDKVKEVFLSFDGIKDYYSFQENPNIYTQAKGGVFNVKNISYYKNLKVPRNLAPQKISWKYKDANGEHIQNIFNHWRVKGQIQAIDAINRDDTILDKKKAIEEAKKKYDAQQAFLELKDGKYVLEDGTTYEVSGIVENQAAEIIMSNLYATKFGIKESDSMYDIISKGENAFNVPKIQIASNNYDIAFTKGDGNHLFVTFKPINVSNTIRANDWTNINKVEYNSEFNLTKDSPKVKTRIYATNEDNIRLFEIGREVINNEVVWNENQKCFVKNGKRVLNQKNYRRDGNDVLEYIEFVSPYTVTETFEKGGTKNYTTYNINRANIKRCLEYDEKHSSEEKQESEVNFFISNLLNNIYRSDSFAGIELNSTLTGGSKAVLQNTLYGFSRRINFDSTLKDHIESLYNKVSKAKKEENGNYKITGLDLIRSKYARAVRKRQYVSFLKSREFTVARIPAQTLQSFMKMKNVAFSGIKTGQCFVAAIQTWLQGSDYDIDKAYVMGLSFDSNGKYIGWSDLFNYDSIELLNASEELPVPKGVKYVKINNDTREKLNKELENAIKNNEDTTAIKYQIEKLSDTVNIGPIENTKDEIQKLKQYAKLLNTLNKHIYEIDGKLYVNVSFSGDDTILNDLQRHENTKIPKILSQEMQKNFISSHIQNVVQDLSNSIVAYSPIEMDVIGGSVKYSSKGNSSNKLTLINPACKYIMQYSNMVGKNVIGISANGEKALFMWNYYLTDLIKNKNADERKYGHFAFTTNRIINRAYGDVSSYTITGLPDLNMQGVPESIQAEFGNRILDNLIPHLMNSQMLSAATDLYF